MDWKDWVLAAWAVLVASPGFIALLWQWQDRRQDKNGPPLVAHVRKALKARPLNGWIPIRVLFRNDGKYPIIVSKVKIDKGYNICMSYPSIDSLESIPAQHSEERLSSISSKLLVRPALHEARGELLSAQTLFFISSKCHCDRSVQIEMCFEYQSTCLNARKQRICVISEPIEITTEETANA